MYETSSRGAQACKLIQGPKNHDNIIILGDDVLFLFEALGRIVIVDLDNTFGCTLNSGETRNLMSIIPHMYMGPHSIIANVSNLIYDP